MGRRDWRALSAAQRVLSSCRRSSWESDGAPLEDGFGVVQAKSQGMIEDVGRKECNIYASVAVVSGSGASAHKVQSGH
jgi:hypothetical protein